MTLYLFYHHYSLSVTLHSKHSVHFVYPTMPGSTRYEIQFYFTSSYYYFSCSFHLFPSPFAIPHPFSLEKLNIYLRFTNNFPSREFNPTLYGGYLKVAIKYNRKAKLIHGHKIPLLFFVIHEYFTFFLLFSFIHSFAFILAELPGRAVCIVVSCVLCSNTNGMLMKRC